MSSKSYAYITVTHGGDYHDGLWWGQTDAPSDQNSWRCACCTQKHTDEYNKKFEYEGNDDYFHVEVENFLEVEIEMRRRRMLKEGLILEDDKQEQEPIREYQGRTDEDAT